MQRRSQKANSPCVLLPGNAEEKIQKGKHGRSAQHLQAAVRGENLLFPVSPEGQGRLRALHQQTVQGEFLQVQPWTRRPRAGAAEAEQYNGGFL